MSAIQRLQSFGLTLPPPPQPLGAYVPIVRSGSLLFLSGQGPVLNGKALMTGKVGRDLSEAEAVEAARLTALNLLSALHHEIGLDAVRRVVKLTGYVNCIDGFARQPAIINGASELLVAVLGDAGRHARAAIGVNALPLDIPVEIELIAEI